MTVATLAASSPPSQPTLRSLPSLHSNDFELFELPPRFRQDRANLDRRWKDLQRQAHPDKFAAQGAAAQRVAMQWSVRINEAYQRLKDPLQRAAYLCELNGAAIHAETNTAMPPAFLLQQMELREALDDASTLAEIELIHSKLSETMRDTLQNCERLLDEKQDFKAAAGQVRALMFIERFAQDVDARMEQFELNPKT